MIDTHTGIPHEGIAMPVRRKRGAVRDREAMDEAVTVRLPSAMLAALEAIATREERVLADVVRRTIRAGLDVIAAPAAKPARSQKR
jgi:hypothetical protein